MCENDLISIVDDDESVRDSLRSLIRSMGFKAQVFASAEKFLMSDLIEQTTCMIVDVRMPGMNGLELQRELVRMNRQIPIIFMSARDDEATRARAIKDGAVDFLGKPFSEDALLNAIHLALQ